jgi:Tfp pilus assembly protein PilV
LLTAARNEADEAEVSTATPSTAFRDEAGFGLIEAVVSALLVVLVSLGIYAGIDGASATSGINKHRSVATEIAQQDQDRMRAMTVTELSNYRDSQSTTIGGLAYTVVSRADWVTDSTGSATCTSGTAQANYLRIASSVTWPGMRIQPITVESITAPPNGSFGSNQGSLAVQVRDRNGNPVQGATVTLTGPQGYTDVTNASGCVLWGYLPAGNGYTVSVAKAGYVDPSGVAGPSKAAGVVGESTSTIAFDYDVGGRIQGNYETWNGSTAVPANGLNYTASNPNLTVPLAPFGDGSPHTSFTTGLIYPFTVGYSVWAGDCAGASPTVYSQAAQTALVNPGAITTVALREPPINMKVIDSSLSPQPLNNVAVKFTPTASGCSVPVTRSTTNTGTGLLTDSAFPYGTYTFCVAVGGKIRTTTTIGAATLSNSTPTGITTANATVDMKSAPAGSCP